MILKDILHLLNTIFPYIYWPAQWIEVVDLIESCKHDVKVTSVIRKTPPPSRYKLNTDGSALHNPRKIGGGGILRDEQGEIIYAFAIPLERPTVLPISCPSKVTKKTSSNTTTLATNCHMQYEGKEASHSKEHISKEEQELVRVLSKMNQGNNQNTMHTPNQMFEDMNQEQRKRNANAIIDENVKKNLQVERSAATKQNQIKKMPMSNEQVGTFMDKQHNNGEKFIWQAKDKISSKDNTTQHCEEEERNQQTNSSKEAGKSVNLDHNTNIVIENDGLLMQTNGNGGVDQQGLKDHNQMNSKIPPPIKISSNFDVYRPVQQKITQNNVEQTLKKTLVSNSVNKNNHQQIPDPAPPTVTQSLATRLRANQLKNATPMIID
ncbi:hypothetical protein MTR67_039026 [Solanum verrucosum]|uniref:RNase H type-1 domain-containing protein n=1 Tax=Solanum verrucosum TaxID=315347 RepID=A0AAF0UHJ7_SOLVR|nr:hypothetical protein MTR67_039026 [Solanum verrucosum]